MEEKRQETEFANAIERGEIPTQAQWRKDKKDKEWGVGDSVSGNVKLGKALETYHDSQKLTLTQKRANLLELRRVLIVYLDDCEKKSNWYSEPHKRIKKASRLKKLRNIQSLLPLLYKLKQNLGHILKGLNENIIEEKIREYGEPLNAMKEAVEKARKTIVEMTNADSFGRFYQTDEYKNNAAEWDKKNIKPALELIPGIPPSEEFELFYKFAEKEFSTENPNFIRECSEFYNSLINVENANDVQAIKDYFVTVLWNKYVSSDAKTQVNISSANQGLFENIVNREEKKTAVRTKSINIDSHLNDDSYDSSYDNSFDAMVTDLSLRISNLEEKVDTMGHRFERDFAHLRRLFREYQKQESRRSRSYSDQERAKMLAALRYLEKKLLN